MATIWNAQTVAMLKQLVGDVDDAKIAAIVELAPNWEDVEEAVAWFEGRGDVHARSGRPLTGKVAQIFEVLSADLDDESRLH